MKIAPELGLGFGPRWRLVLELGGNQTISPEENCPLRLGLGFGLGLVLGFGDNFPRGIFLEPLSYTSAYKQSYTSKQSLT